MTTTEKLETYENAVILLNSIPDFPWPQISMLSSVTVNTDKNEGQKNIQSWFEITKGWKIVVTERWKDEAGEMKSSRVITEDLPASDAGNMVEGEL